MKKINHKILRQLIILSLIIFLGGLIIKYMLPYISGVLGALTLYVVLRKWMLKLINKGIKRMWAAMLLIFASLIGIFIPLTAAGFMLSSELSNLADKSEQVTKAFKDQLFQVEKYIEYDISSTIDPKQASGWLTDNMQGFASGTFNVLISLGILLFLLYYMLKSPKQLKESLLEYIPLSNKNLMTLGKEIDSVVRSNAIAIPLVALAQGIIALIGFYVFGVDNPLFWFVIVTIGSMIPFIGTFIGIFPVFVLSLANGEDFQAWGILLYGILVVGMTDNVIRLFVLKQLDSTHPLITLIGVLIGIPLFGFVGLIFGPLIINLFLIIVKIYKQQYGIQKSTKQNENKM
ncbi:MAG TPA: AI-2E family transporter [Maribacter sp.]|mgnify:FL=1|uniref:AI-2E family transporter n=1 Tax=unclassified Maribacter TaxID=2615042 RepID=UPI000ED090F4|nr:MULTISPECIES: AI-2E family transporter [unclassified Maribacter]HAF76427.1 AI-2E family transporter [Maribacter sp.]HAI44533.1 AI-2E family transporter [Maribacter sp.]|tara:strand:+ start:37741 stop:38778 length:1038 start_codon:yes stop_codon:yes gene_type:complete